MNFIDNMANKSYKEKLEEERIKQDKFYRNLIGGLEEGRIAPSEVLDFEDVDVPCPEEIAKLPKEEFRLLNEKIGLASKLQETRKILERKDIELAVAERILEQRKKEVDEKLKKMTPAEREEFEMKSWEAL